jgi:putative acetyltransferase
VESDKTTRFALRDYAPADEDEAIALWLRSWTAAYPAIDFDARLGWWRKRWHDELVPNTRIVVAGIGISFQRMMVGFVTLDPATGYIDQIVVAPEFWGSGIGTLLIEDAKRRSPQGLELDVNTDNIRAIRFYESKGFSITADGTNPVSGKPVYRMSWRA